MALFPKEKINNLFLNNDVNAIRNLMRDKNFTYLEKLYFESNIPINLFIKLIVYLIYIKELERYFDLKFVLKKIQKEFLDLNVINVKEMLLLMNYNNEITKIFLNRFTIRGIIKKAILEKERQELIEQLLKVMSYAELLSIFSNKLYMSVDDEKNYLEILIKNMSNNISKITEDDYRKLEHCFFNKYIISKRFLEFYCQASFEEYDVLEKLTFYYAYPSIVKLCFNEPYDSNNLRRELKSANNTIYFGFLCKLLHDKNCEYQIIYQNGLLLLSNSSKFNTSKKNPNFNFSFVKKIYPILGLNLSLNLLQYDSKAIEIINNLIDDNKVETIKSYIDFCSKNNLLTEEASSIHNIFLGYANNKEFFTNILKTNPIITGYSQKILDSIICGENFVEVRSTKELLNYENLLYEKIMAAREIDDIALCFGYKGFTSLIDDLESYRLNNPAVLKCIYLSALNSSDASIKFTSEDMKLIKILINTIKHGLDYFKKVCQERFENGLLLNFNLKNIIAKIKKIYAQSFNNEFTQIESLNDCEYKYIDDVKIIEVKDKEYNFFIHVLYGLDLTYKDYPNLLVKNPSLWTKLEGASTISLSTISEKNGSFVGKMLTENKIKLLFNHINNEDLITMNMKDVGAEHGGHVLNPMFCNYRFYDIKSLNYVTSQDGLFGYNEIVIKRNNQIPCAIATFNQNPNPLEINFAKQFNVPILSLNNDTKNIKASRYEKNKKLLEIHANIYNIYEFLYSGENFLKDLLWLVNLIQNQKNERVITGNECLEMLLKLYYEAQKSELDDVIEYLKDLWQLNAFLINEFKDDYFIDIQSDLLELTEEDSMKLSRYKNLKKSNM